MIQGSLTKMDGVSAARGLTTFSRSGNLIIDTFIQSYAFIVGVGAIPVRLYYRENLGERAFSPFALIVCLIFYGYIGIYGAVISVELLFLIIVGSGSSVSSFTSFLGIGGLIQLFIFSPLMLLLLFTANMGIKHFKRVFREADENEVVRYSYYRGDTRYFKDFIGMVNKRGKVLTEQYVRLNLEPWRAARVGFLIFLLPIIIIVFVIFMEIEIGFMINYLGFFTITGFIIMFSAFCLYLEEFGIKLRVRGKVLDMTDGEYDMIFIRAERDKLKLTTDGVKNSDKRIVNKLSDEDSIVVS